MKIFNKDIFKRLRFKYNVIVLNEHTLDEVFHIHLSRLSIITIMSLFSIISFALLSLLIFTTPLKHMLPGYADVAVKRQVTAQVLEVDSLSEQIESSNRQLQIIKYIISGNISPDSISSIDSLDIARWDSISLKPSANELAFVEEYENDNMYNVNKSRINEPVITFARPVRGTVTSGFAPELDRNGISLLANPTEPVMASQDGNIIFTNYTVADSYTIVIQHKKDYLTIYRNLGRILRRAGDKVMAGEAIGFVGDPTLKDNNPQIMFELWLSGNALNPEDYIVF